MGFNIASISLQYRFNIDRLHRKSFRNVVTQTVGGLIQALRLRNDADERSTGTSLLCAKRV